MIINLKGPNGKVLNLFNRRGDAFGQVNLINTTFTNTSTTALPAIGAPFTGTYKPDGVLGIGPTAFPSNVPDFNGVTTKGNGAWTIAINDNAAFDAGTLTSWTITITYQVLTNSDLDTSIRFVY
jgi:hypothetical protein